MHPHSKNQSVAEWHTLLRDSKRWANASAQYRFLLGLADRMLAAGQIEPMERFEMVELLTGAFCFHIEETPQAWRIPSADYLVYNEAGCQIGSVSGNRYYLHNPESTYNPVDFFAQIHEAEGDQPVITRTYAHYGIFRDRYIITETGQTLTLVESGRMINGVMVERLADPDVYRSLIDAAVVALEEGDMQRYITLWEKENFSIFRQCSRCCDRFDLREDCSACSGLGFVEDPNCPNRLPQHLQKRAATQEDLGTQS